MQRNDKCLGCLINQVIKVAEMTEVENKNDLTKEKILKYFENREKMDFYINDEELLKKDIYSADQLLYVGDNCGEVCLDKLFLDQFATIISNGDCALGTILHKCSKEFIDVFNGSDLVIAKGQANYESLSERADKKIYFMLMTKCDVIAKDIGVPLNQLMCFSNNNVR